MVAPHTSLTIPMPISDMSGLMVERLYMNIRMTAFSSILAVGDLVPSVGPDGANTMYTLIDCLSYAIAAEVVAEIKNHSCLTAAPGSTDKGIAGAGIIAGWTK
jgi:hypothetical protein